MDKEDHYVKRCVALPGDSLSVRNGLVWVNGAQQEVYPGIQLTYRVVTTGQRINERTLKKLGLNLAELSFDSDLPGYPAVALTAAMLEQVKGWSFVTSVEPNLDVFPPDFPDSYLSLFPFTENFQWTRDNYGPIWIPKKGATVALTAANLPLYRRIIDVYEARDLRVGANGKIFIDGMEATSYTFKQDYFMMGDNRHNSWIRDTGDLFPRTTSSGVRRWFGSPQTGTASFRPTSGGAGFSNLSRKFAILKIKAKFAPLAIYLNQ